MEEKKSETQAPQEETVKVDPNVVQEVPIQTETAIVSKPPKSSKGKSIGVILIFVLLFGVVIFLPQISSYLDSRKHTEEIVKPNTEEEPTMTRICTLNKQNSSQQTSITLEFVYQNNALKKETLTNVVIPLDNNEIENLRDMQLRCQAFKDTIEQQEGIKQECSLSDNRYSITQEIDYSKLEDITSQQNIGELEGFYPEFTLNQDRMVIETQLTDVGYSCRDA